MTDPDALVDLGAMKEMAAGCGWTLPRMAEAYLEESARAWEKLAAALSRGDADEVARIAHGWGGASAMAGVRAMHRDLLAIEDRAKATGLSEVGPLVDGLAARLREVETLLRAL